jgi:L-ascorbate metabolism protein UlaG (beta-lactamase superfamily)
MSDSQSTCIVTLDGLTILTDPVFSARSVNDYIGPKRLRTVPGSIKDYKGIIDIVLVSHDHFDHLGKGQEKDCSTYQLYANNTNDRREGCARVK